MVRLAHLVEEDQMMHLNEEFLHYIWKYRLLTSTDLYCTEGEELRILHQGELNTNAGPDFMLARLRIEGITWLGNVEIHIRSSDWGLHGHHLDKAYDTVILHAVYTDDCPVYRSDGSRIPTLVLKGLLPEMMYSLYLNLINARNVFPCSPQMKYITSAVKEDMLVKMLQERLEEKSAEVMDKSARNHNNWNETFYYLLLRNFGFKINTVPFEILANSLPSTILVKHRDNALQIEALLFGQAGFLEGAFNDAYPQQLKAEYGFLRKKYHLKPMDLSLWKFLRIRPNNFPTRRIAQLAALLLHKHHFLSLIIEVRELKELRALFTPPEINKYWDTHFHFDKEVKKMKSRFGHQSVDSLIINTVCISLYSFGKSTDKPGLKDRALTLLKEIPAERNALTAMYSSKGMDVKCAFHSQSVIHLNKSYCNQKKCLNCIIGSKILIQ